MSPNVVANLAAMALLSLSAAIIPIEPAAAQVPTTEINPSADDIVVIAQRIGIPVWRVTGPRTTIVLVGSIGKVVPGTHWDPGALDAALVQADRVVFPESMDISFGLFSVIGMIGKWRAQASLPKGQTLQALTTPEQWSRLVALRDKGILKPGFERTHPYHLAVTLSRLTREKRKMEPGADAHVRRYLGKNKEKWVPLPQANVKAVTAEFFGSAPSEHIPCLMDTVTQVEAGQAGIDARSQAQVRRSQAWAARRVADAVAASAQEGRRSCWPRGSRFERMREASLGPAIRDLLDSPETTLAVVSLDTLAKSGGVLDNLVEAGFDIRGPRWTP